MYNWSTDTKILSKYPEKYKIWQLEQLINFGLGEERIKYSDLKKYINKLEIDPQKKKYLRFILSYV
ncbi:MAG: hypothetical protein ACD_31C00119G0002 [uncultured bacterium]|nr:MAG: hypothetical protein ACD_31C00119G0002 [uncultured bacterium]